jgi:predicted esterase
LVTIDDFETVSRAYRVMLQELFDTVPYIAPERSALGGFSNGAHTTALLLAGQDAWQSDLTS